MTYKLYSIITIVLFVIVLDLLITVYLALEADQTIDHDLLPDWATSHKNDSTILNGTTEPASTTAYFGFPLVNRETHKYNFFACQLDFILVGVLRVLILLIALGLLCFSNDKQNKLSIIRSLQTPAICLFFAALSYGQVKVLALSEIEQNYRTYPWFWAIFSSNFILSVVAGFIYASVICRYDPLGSENIEAPPLQNDKSLESVLATKNMSTGHKPREDVQPLVYEGQYRPIAENPAKISSPTITKIAERIGSIRYSTTTQPRYDNLARQQSTTSEFRMDVLSTDETLSEIQSFNPSQSASLMLRLLKYCRYEWIWYLFGFVFLFFNSAARIFVPWYTARVISDIVVYQSSARLFRSFIIMVILSIFSSVFAGLRSGCFMYAINKVNVRIRSELFSSLVKQEIGFFDVTRTGEITSRLTSDCQVMSDTVASNVNLFLRSLIMLSGALIMMFNLSWRMTLMVFVIMPVVALISKVYGKYYDMLASQGQDALAKSNEVADEVLSSMRTVRSFANEHGESKRYDIKLLDVLRNGKLKSIAFTGFTWINELIDLIVLAAVLWYGGHLVMTKRLLPEDMIAYLLYQLQVAETLISMGAVYTGLMQAVGSSRKVFALIDRKPLIANNGTVTSHNLRGRIDFKDVTFAYPSRPNVKVLRNVSFTVQPGEVCALVGPSGGGKSSCIGLLQHFYEPLSGRVLLDGQPVCVFDHKFYHKSVSLVGQEPVLYAKSIAENIGYALNESDYNIHDVVEASKLANAHQFIVSLGKGYNTDVGEKGVQLSGGQKQRIAIARALIRRPKLLLLDEATSALDAESEHLVQKALYENLSGYTVILIAHRLSTVRKADRIIVIDKGHVVQQGSHDDLIKEDGLYKSLVQRQLVGEADSTDDTSDTTGDIK